MNPVAGIGGRVGLKGSDGADVQRLALRMGAVPEAGARARRALEALVPLDPGVELLVAPSVMGRDAAEEAGLSPVLAGEINPGATTSADTRRIAREMRDAGVDLLLFAGGDGTARDVFDAIDRSVVVLGIAAGVKVYSAVFAVNPSRAGELAVAYMRGGMPVRDGEVLDLDEDAYRAGRVSPALHGYLRVPYRRDAMQGGKEPTPQGESAAADEIARDVVERLNVFERLDPARHHILGPGTTTLAIANRLGLPKTLVGVDVIRRGTMVLADANERQLAELAERVPTTVIVTPIGGQGFIFGRGNPQIGPRVLGHILREDILVVATQTKLGALHGRPLLVDTGDPAADAGLVGYLPVITGYHETTVYRITA